MTDDLFASAPLPIAPLGDEERLACLRLIRSEQVGPVTFRNLINHFGGAQQALEALPELSRQGGLKRPIRICSRRDAEHELVAARAIGATPLFTIEPGYPRPLASLDQPPPLIYVKGRVELLGMPAIALVGSRRCSAAGQAMARQLATRLGVEGLVIISGLARGIDAAAHHAALESGTIAVLAGGLDRIYPPENEALHHAIADKGCLVTERPPGFQPRGQDFPRRNRIISGVSLAVVVIEAAERSGSLITARIAAEQGRHVYAVPGHPLDPRAHGTNRLIRSGATMVTCADDILEDISSSFGIPMAQPPGDGGFHEPEPARGGQPPIEISETDRTRVQSALGTSPVDLD
ncbi:MAG TPA: DNA-processing protein DprA [Hyphomicrobiaceae bacterium]|nr:DNA-processing protein DprA [Hyphomicrobiaceae bacterium]